MIGRLVVFGGTGDLTGRYLLPALAALRARGQLPEPFELTGAGRDGWDDEQYRDWAAGWLLREVPDVDAGARSAVVEASRYHRLDLADAAGVAACIAGEGPVAVYLALPPAAFPTAISALRRAGLPPGSEVIVEKPFGEDLDSALELNRLLAELTDERHVFRVDHFLAMTTVQNVLGTRLANRVLEPIWNSAHIDEIEIVWDESLALEGRAGYYDGVGALKDMVQNHLLQLLCLVAMEPPISLGERDLRDRKVDVLRSVRAFEDDDVAARTRRGRYRAGRVVGRLLSGRATVFVHVWEAIFRRELAARALAAGPVEEIGAIVEELHQAVADIAAARMQEGLAAARASGLEAMGETVETNEGAWRAIAAAARTHGASVIAAGTRGLGAARSALLGSVSSGLVHNAELPILVVPDAAPAATSE